MKNNGFTIDNENIYFVKQMKYLGIVFNSNCTFQTAVDNLRNKSIKAMFKLFKSFGNTTPNIKTSKLIYSTP